MMDYMYRYRKEIERITVNQKNEVGNYLTGLYNKGLVNSEEYCKLKDYAKTVGGDIDGRNKIN